jgi:hypothetical protein
MAKGTFGRGGKGACGGKRRFDGKGRRFANVAKAKASVNFLKGGIK